MNYFSYIFTVIWNTKQYRSFLYDTGIMIIWKYSRNKNVPTPLLFFGYIIVLVALCESFNHFIKQGGKVWMEHLWNTIN